MKIHEKDIPPGTKIDPSWEIIEDEPEELKRSKEPCKSAESDLSILNKYKPGDKIAPEDVEAFTKAVEAEQRHICPSIDRFRSISQLCDYAIRDSERAVKLSLFCLIISTACLGSTIALFILLMQ